MMQQAETFEMSTLRIVKSKAAHIDGAQFQFGLDEAALSPERFADLFATAASRASASG